MDTRWCNTVTELHSGINFMNQKTTLLIFQHINGQDTTADSLSSASAKAIQIACHGTIAGHCATSGIGHPVLARTINCADRSIPYNKGSDITLGLSNILLNIMNMMLIRTKS